MNPSLDVILRVAPAVSGILFFIIFVAVKIHRNQKCELYDAMVVGFTGGSIPTGCLLVYAAFDSSALAKLTDASMYIAFAGLAVLYIAVMSLREKL